VLTLTDFATEKTIERRLADDHPGTDSVPRRDMDFDRWLDDLPKYFAADGDILMSHILTVLSSVFPDGEDFFVRSVTAVMDQVHDERLLAEVDGFVGQESMHGREHRALNDRLAALGYPTRAIGRYVQILTAIRERIQGKKANVGFTAALEHYTATLAETLLTDEAARNEIGYPGARDLLMWHALEESEHKAVAFDVFRAIGGTELMRQVTMWITHLTFVLETATWTAISVLGDSYARRHPWMLAKSTWRLRKSPFTKKGPVKLLFEYHRPGFHPNDRDTSDLIAKWREQLFGPEGTLRAIRAA
jgi:predicted metal-dependent hydrolase